MPLDSASGAAGAVSAPASRHLIEVDRVTFGYDSSRLILNDISLNFERGKITAILGGSGCGKTTLLRLIGGVHAATAGQVRFDGQVIDVRNRERLYAMRRRLGMLFRSLCASTPICPNP
jgi:phospholipid/cholesterol/gamma-HCH transport system ATP-binding protein